MTATILSHDGNGTASQTLINTVERALNDENVHPVADLVIVQSDNIIPYQVDATLYLLPALEYEQILQTAHEKLTAYTREQHRLSFECAVCRFTRHWRNPGGHSRTKTVYQDSQNISQLLHRDQS